MIRHIVMFRFLEEAMGRSRRDNAVLAKKKLENLAGVVPSVLKMEVHLNDEDAQPSNYDLVLITEHEDLEGLRLYASHPEHENVSEFIGRVKESRACVDFKI